MPLTWENGSTIPRRARIRYPNVMSEELIYCVDDEEGIRALYEEALPLGGYCCQTFVDGSSFWSAIKSKRPDLIVLDIMLPGDGGLSILRNLMAGEYASIPVIMVSAKGKETDKVKGLNEGASDYLVKPFGVMELLARIKANLRKIAPKKGIFFKNLVIDEKRHEISLNGALLRLSHKEYDLLVYFVANSERAIRKEELLDKVWGVNCDIETRTLDIFVSKLRKKLQDSDVHIDTIRGVGYILR